MSYFTDNEVIHLLSIITKYQNWPLEAIIIIQKEMDMVKDNSLVTITKLRAKTTKSLIQIINFYEKNMYSYL